MRLQQAAKYFLTSAGTFCLNLFVIWALVHFGKTEYLTAVAAGFATETSVLYVANRLWTFAGAVRTEAGQGYARAWLVALSTLGLIMGLEWLLVGFGLNYLVARVALSPAAYAWSFVWDGSFTFKAFGFQK
jgi:putative flippase GtrA